LFLSSERDTRNMTFIGKKALIQEYLDTSIFDTLSPQYQHFITRLFQSESNNLDKFFTKLSGNQVNLNADMITRILDTLFNQMTTPFAALHDTNFGTHHHQDELMPHIFNTSVWEHLLKNLKIWSAFPQSTIYENLSMAHYFVATDTYPPITLNPASDYQKKFWQKKMVCKANYFDTAFKFIYEKLKHFHWELIPNTKRHMDLYELYCLIEDAALEKNLIQYHEDQLLFLRSLNASALIYSVICSFPASLPDMMAFSYDHRLNTMAYPYWDLIKKHQDFQPFYGHHPYLENINMHGFYVTLKHIIEILLKNAHIRPETNFKHKIKVLQSALYDPKELENIHTYFQNQTHRLIFIYTRLTSLGFLMRSPLLKGLGFHPLINTETPVKMMNNLNIFIEILKQAPIEEQYRALEQMVIAINPAQEITDQIVSTSINL